ncbi:MAG: site-specific DNA-methyltransferase [Gammaproteobacteria bacterium AqS3]|nr:site-specific DNA-methyltransferase [Gammaproteobacteria bacterium AqS3]
MIHHGDNLPILEKMATESIDLIATDPPYCTGRDFGAYDDRWNTPRGREATTLRCYAPDVNNYVDMVEEMVDAALSNYLVFMAVRLIEMRRILKNTGSIYLQCDIHNGAYLRVLMDLIFEHKNFRNEIVWCYTSPSAAKKKFPAKHDSIFFYSKTDNYFFDDKYIRVPYKRAFGRKGSGIFKDSDMSDDEIQEYMEKGKMPTLWWDEFTIVGRLENERLGYPTQKPVALYERICNAGCPPDGVVLDPFCGSGTTLVAAYLQGKGYVGIDENPEAIELANQRLNPKRLL